MLVLAVVREESARAGEYGGNVRREDLRESASDLACLSVLSSLERILVSHSGEPRKPTKYGVKISQKPGKIERREDSTGEETGESSVSKDV